MTEQRHGYGSEERERRSAIEAAGEPLDATDTEPERESTPDHPPPRIWVGVLADYVNGELVGKWIDANQYSEMLAEDIEKVVALSQHPGAEEYAIFDYEGFYGVRLNAHESLGHVSELALGITTYGEPFAAWAELVGIEEVCKDIDRFEECFIGQYDRIEEMIEDMWTDMGFDAELDKVLPDSIRWYVNPDFETWARDMQLAGEVEVARARDGTVFAFRPV